MPQDSPKLSWIEQYDNVRGMRKLLGAIGFVDDRWAIIVAYFDDRDGDHNGVVTLTEKVVSRFSPVSVYGREIAAVAYMAALNTDVYRKDSSFYPVGEAMRLGFVANLVVDQTFSIYLKGAAGTLAGSAVSGIVQRFVVKKGMEAIIKKAFEASKS